MTRPAVRAATPADRSWIAEVARRRLGDNVQAARGATFVVSRCPALIAEVAGDPVGFLSWQIADGVCEVMALATIEDGSGVARALLDAVHGLARDRRCRELRVVTTDHNTRAQELYVRNGYEVVEVRRGAVDRARRTVKPEIPEGIHDEIEYARPV